MVINRIHLGSVVFARTLAASFVADRRREGGDRNTTTMRSNRRQLPQAPEERTVRVRSMAETT